MTVSDEDICHRLRITAEGDDEMGGRDVVQEVLNRGLATMRGERLFLTRDGREFLRDVCGITEVP